MVTAVFVLSNSATPLYVHWQDRFAFSSATLTVIFAAYIAGLLGALLVAGQLSDRLGRKTVVIPGILTAMVASGLFITASSVAALVAARFLTGIAVGVMVSAGMAAVMDMGGKHRRRQAALAASVAMVLGAGLGPLLAGTLAQALARPIPPIFGLVLTLLLSALAIAVTSLPAPSRDKNVIRPRRMSLPSVPPQNRMDLAMGIAVFAPGITATSFMLSLGPTLLSNSLHVGSPLVAGGTACLMFMSATGVQFLVKKLPIRTVLLLGAAATVLSMATTISAIYTSAPALLFIAAILAGMGQGQGQLGGLTLIGLKVPDQHRAQANSLLNIGGYIPAGLLPVGTGFLIDAVGLAVGTAIFAVVLISIAAAAAFFVATRLPR
jgi:MFS family permease